MSYKDTGLIFAGNIYMAKIENDEPQNFRGPINVTRLELTPPQPESVDRTSFQRDTYGQVLDSVNLPGESPTIAMDFDSLPTDLLADALAGTVEDYSPAAGSVTAEAITLVEGLWVKLPHAHIDPETISVLLASDGTTELEEGTDYQLEPVTGLIRALSAEGAADVEIDYDRTEATGQRVLGATEITKRRQIIMDGRNLVTGKNCSLTVYRASFSATQALDLMSQEFITGTLEGTLTTPEGMASPYEVLMLD